MGESLSIWSLVVNAGGVVQMVLLLLFVASVMSWAMIYQRTVYYAKSQKGLETFEDEFWSGVDLGQLYLKSSKQAKDGEIEGVENFLLLFISGSVASIFKGDIGNGITSCCWQLTPEPGIAIAFLFLSSTIQPNTEPETLLHIIKCQCLINL